MANRKADDSVGGDGPGGIDWSALLAHHDRWLRTVVAARLFDGHEVDDVMQEVALAAVRQASPISDPAKAAPWLYRIAVRQCLLYRRSRGRQRKLVDQFTDTFRPTEVDHRTTDPLAWLLADERRDLVREAIERLHRRDAEMLLLKYTEDWTYREIAEHVGVSQSAIEARLHRARCRLRKELQIESLAEVLP